MGAPLKALPRPGRLFTSYRVSKQFQTNKCPYMYSRQNSHGLMVMACDVRAHGTTCRRGGPSQPDGHRDPVRAAAAAVLRIRDKEGALRVLLPAASRVVHHVAWSHAVCATGPSKEIYSRLRLPLPAHALAPSASRTRPMGRLSAARAWTDSDVESTRAVVRWRPSSWR